jgi:PPOX class probable F420-dependent enzyme
MAKLSDDQAKLLTDPNIAVIATIRPDGTPQVTPTWIDYDGEHVLVNTAAGRAKAANLQRDPRVSVFVLDPDNPYNWVSVTGPAELTQEGAEEAEEHINKLSHKYNGTDYPEPKNPPRVLAKVTPERVNGPSY